MKVANLTKEIILKKLEQSIKNGDIEMNSTLYLEEGEEEILLIDGNIDYLN